MQAPFLLSLIDLPALQDIATSPTYTDIFNETLGDAATDADGFPNAMADVLARVAAFEADHAETETAVNIGAAIDSFAATDPAGLDTSMAGYVGAMPIGKAHLAAGQALAPPPILEFPISPGFGTGIVAPAVQVSVTLDTLTAGGPVVLKLLGSYRVRDGVWSGFSNATLADGDPLMFGIVDTLTSQTSTESHDTEYHQVSLSINPYQAGTFIAQLNQQADRGGPFTITTYTATVTP